MPEFISSHKSRPLSEYSASLWEENQAGERETLLKRAFREELERCHPDSGTLAEELCKTPFLQTSHHITPTNGPVFGCVDLLSLCAKPPALPYFVAANSGVAFSNPAWSGALSYGESKLDEILEPGSGTFSKALRAQEDRRGDGTAEKRISLIPSAKRDALLFKTPMPDQTSKSFGDFRFSQRFRELRPEKYEDYPTWAMMFCQTVQRQIFETDNLYYIDINRVLNRYLQSALGRQGHVVPRILFERKTAEAFADAFENPVFFLANEKKGKSEKVGTLRLKQVFEEYSPETLANQLERGQLCCGTFPAFFVLCHLNGFACGGSFYQFEYLRDYLEKWQTLLPNEGRTRKLEKTNLFTGGKWNENGKAVYPFDLWVAGKTVSPSDYGKFPMKRFWAPLGIGP